ncbi:MAG: hypothetical protein JWL76_1067 [Thermoleophilia bacterium]|nr:hypothetical protein [Thermoleophilia bacterium]
MMRRHESAFTVVEIIIAVLLVTVVISGITIAIAGTTKLETKRDIKSRMVAATERVYEHIRSDKAWVKSCRRATATSPAKTCNLTPIIDSDLLEDDIFGDSFAFVATASATGVDSDGDERSAADIDGNADDFFKIAISISVPAGDATRLGSPPTRKVESIVNGSTTVDNGGLLVAFCSADNQIDERVQISGCETGGAYWTDMPACAGDDACLPWSLPSLKGIPPAMTSPSRMLGIRPVSGVSFSLAHVDDGEPYDGPPVVPSSLAVTSSSDPSLAPGVYKFPDLQAGSWKIVTPSTYPGGRINWETHHVPSTLQATVERNRTARALVMLQDPAAAGTYKMTFSRLIYERSFVGDVHRVRDDKIPECEAPASFYAGAFVVESRTCDEPTGHFVAESKLGHMGERMDESKFFTRYQSWGRYQDYADVYYFSQSRSQDEWPGAADTASFAVQPAPLGRYTVRTDGPSGPTYDVPTWSTGTIPEAPHKPAAGYKSTGTSAAITGLPAGLHTPVTMQTASSKISNVSTTYSPAGCDPAFMWVRADTSGLGGCTSSHMVGDDGECYTHLNGGVGIPNYNWKDGCGSLWWISHFITKPKDFLIYKICGHRQSWVLNAQEETWAEYKFEPNWFDWAAEDIPEYDTPEYNAEIAKQRAAYEAERSGRWGFTLMSGTAHGIGGANGYWYKKDVFGDSSRIHDSPCDDMTSAPLDCPSLNRYDNCNRSEEVTITKSPGWDVGGGNEDGHKFQQKHTGFKIG